MPKVLMIWGEQSTSITEHNFVSQEEVDAYLLGVSDCDGWTGFKSIEDLTIHDILNLSKEMKETTDEIFRMLGLTEIKKGG